MSVAVAGVGFKVLDSFGVFDSLKSPTQTELKLDEISDQLDALDQRIEAGFAAILENAATQAIIQARADSNNAATLIGTLLTPQEQATALAQAVSGVSNLNNAIDGVLQISAEISPALLQSMVNALSYSMTVLATAAKVWSTGEFTGIDYNHGGLMRFEATFNAGIETLQEIEFYITNQSFHVYGFDFSTDVFSAIGFASFKISHPFVTETLAQAFFENVITEYTPDGSSFTLGAGFVTIKLPPTAGNIFGEGVMSNLYNFTIKPQIDATINDAYYNFMTGLEQEIPSEFGTYSWYGENPQSLVNLLDIQRGLVDGNTEKLVGLDGGRTLNGTAEADYLISGVEGGTLNGLAGDDYLQGKTEDDILLGGEGSDVYAPGAGDDRIEDTGSADDGDIVVLEGSSLDWDFYLINDQLNAIRGDLENPDERDILIGIEGVKFDNTSAPVQTILETADEAEIKGLSVTIVGGSSNDIYDVRDADQRILEQPGGGTDTVLSYVDNYVLPDNIESLWLVEGAAIGFGNDLANTLTGLNLTGNTLYGEGGNDFLTALGENNFLFGGDDNDRFEVGPGANALDGGSGFDTADYSSSDAGVRVVLDTSPDEVGFGSGGSAEGNTLISIEGVIGSKFADVLTGNSEANKLEGGAGTDVIGVISGKNTLDGGSENDLIIGGFGNDDLSGGTGNDVILGDISTNLSGSDRIAGGTGDDLLEGRGGADTFVFATNDGIDTIGKLNIDYGDPSNTTVSGADFVSGLDVIELIGFDFVDQAAAFAAVTDQDGIATFSHQDTTIVFDGLALADLSANDFILV